MCDGYVLSDPKGPKGIRHCIGFCPEVGQWKRHYQDKAAEFAALVAGCPLSAAQPVVEMIWALNNEHGQARRIGYEKKD